MPVEPTDAGGADPETNDPVKHEHDTGGGGGGGRRRPGPRRPEGTPAGPEEVRRALLDAAADLFARRGVENVSLRDVATAAQVNVGLIGRYVGNRHELIEAVFLDLSDQLAEEVHQEPLGQKGFEVDSVMVRWARVLTYLVLVGSEVPIHEGFQPLDALAEAMRVHYGLDEVSSRLRATQVLASALGWRIFEPYLLRSAALPDMTVEQFRDELTATHRRLAATPWPSPEDPPTVD